MKKIIGIICCICIVCLAIFVVISLDNSVKLEVIEYDEANNSSKVVKRIRIKENEDISMEKYDGNDIKILEINDQYVKISRQAVKYEILEGKEGIMGTSREYTEEIVQDIEYGKNVIVNINEREPFGPSYDKPRYTYTMCFKK